MIENYKNTIYGTEDQYEIYDKRQEMKDKMGLVFGQLFALKLHNSTCSLYIEDDGTLYEKIEFHTTWLDDLENVLTEFKKMLKEKNIPTQSQHTNKFIWQLQSTEKNNEC